MLLARAVTAGEKLVKDSVGFVGRMQPLGIALTRYLRRTSQLALSAVIESSPQERLTYPEYVANLMVILVVVNWVAFKRRLR